MDKYERFEEAERKLTERGVEVVNHMFRPATEFVCISLDDFETLVQRVTDSVPLQDSGPFLRQAASDHR